MNYLLVGQEKYLKSGFLERLRKTVADGDAAQLDFERFQEGQDVTEVLNSCNTSPFISKKKLVIVSDIDEFSPKEKDSIVTYLKSPKDSTILVLESKSSEYSNKFLKEISRFAKVIKCNSPDRRELNAWIRKQFAFYNKKIPQSGADLVVELAGTEMYLLKNEIEKIVSFTKDADEISLRDIEMSLGRSACRTAFELVDLVLEKRIDILLSSMDEVLSNEKPHQILSLLAWQFRNFVNIKGLAGDLPAEEIADRLGINRYFAKRLIEQSRRFNQSDLEKNLGIILEADLFIKTGKVDPKLALERAMVGLCS